MDHPRASLHPPEHQVLFFSARHELPVGVLSSLHDCRLAVDWVSSVREAELLLENVSYGVVLVEMAGVDDLEARELLDRVEGQLVGSRVVVVARCGAAAVLGQLADHVRLVDLGNDPVTLDPDLLREAVGA